MVRLVILGGTGDVYLVCALFHAFKAHHNREAQVILRGRYVCIAEMFDVPYVVDDLLVTTAETNFGLQADYDNDMVDGRDYYTHPCFLRSRVRVDHLTTKPDASQADMYRMILRIPPDTPLALPRLPPVPTRPSLAVIIPQSMSWPNEQPSFWTALGARLQAAGWLVEMNNEQWPLAELFRRCAEAEWVLGPQCGTMSILVTGRFPCRKTFAVANVDGNNAPGFLVRQTYPYAYMTKFSNADYDIEEFKVTPGEHAALIDKIVYGANAMRLWSHDPSPTQSITMPLTPGDFLDRLAVLTVKYDRFPPARRAAIAREYHRHVEARRLAEFPPEVDALFQELCNVHKDNFDLLERMVPAAIARASMAVEDHAEAIRANRRRTELKQQIDALCHAPYAEVKSYYDPQGLREAAE